MYKKIKKRLLLIIALIIGSAALFIHKNLVIYPNPNIIFQDSKQRVFEKTDVYKGWLCYQNNEISPNKNRPFKLFNWNIHKGVDNGWQNTLIESANNKDFVLLQEATSLQEIPQTLLHFKQYLHLFAFEYQQQKTGVLSLSSLDANLYCGNQLQEPLLQLPKVMSAMRFPLKNHRSLLLINVHLINFEWHSQGNYQQQLNALKALMQKHTGAIILAGDFNTWNEKRNKQLLELITSEKLSKISLKPDERSTAFGYPLDHIFTRGITVHSATSYSVKSSDHNPLELNFSLE
ncbi:hypothetical protein A4G16_03485 [Mannheimia granulomatis]|uniref:Endonuclease/exonuclease/phosphatase domain-containing protein n=1 Tax=Mannheimia granulomatis TaxID=85402 RepID=A0A6G8JH14_9PAST|nr:endonuclease/exonuclease/phosphatase family protein [Mannheimia granulomatis]QIM66502.1 hypothetical protein A4G16_03485 [Mannheimia granulomatis]